ncbi:unnamed protein product [Cyclocybe aegerita]|uniref:chitin deacetylase n=1 Tax=Cyclocybe aegerita TaxID=1973307 RepID=A0A8S0XS10_CYCAE|nr:unnamed protein product [Cyclocybe aegerita]
MLPSIFTLGVVALSTVRVVEAQDSTPDRTSAAGEASIKDPDQECEAYRYQPVADALASFPSIWQQASILPGDTNAATKWAAIQPNVPDIAPKGTPQGDFSGMSYGSDDPDCWWTVSKCTNPKVDNVPADVSVMPEPRTLGYGFDDGPNCSHNAFYDYLAQQNQKATMFFIGSNVMDWPLEAARAVNDGHEVCIHSWSHNYMTALQSEDAFAELYYSVSLEAVRLATGATPTCWRPPFGDVDDRIRAIANGLGLRTVLWQYDSQDWQVGVTEGVTSDSVDQEYQNMIDDAKKGLFDTVGTMILMHELNDFTMQEAIKYYPKLKEAFDHIVPVAVGMNITHPYIETSFTMPSFAQYIAGTGATLAANSTSSAGTTTASSTTGSSGTASGGVAVESTKTGDASRASGSAGIQMVAALVLGVACAAVVGLLPS